MTIHEFVRRSEMPATSSEVFAWHTNPDAIQRLLPPWEKVRVVCAADRIDDGERAVMSVPIGPFRVRWVAEHDEVREGESFRDVQASGPFALWEHTHRFEPRNRTSSFLEDRIRYALPFGEVGDFAASRTVRRRLERMFDFRHERTKRDLRAHRRFDEAGWKRVLISGANGLIGSELKAFLTTGGHQVVPLSRHGHISDTVRWSPSDGTIEADKLDYFDAVVHLAGATITPRWSAEKKRKIRESRIQGTRLLSKALAGLKKKPEVLVVASAIGFYGDRGDEELTEDSPGGEGFLAEVCRDWEAACEPARQAGIRVVHVRIGLVLTPRGSLLGTLLPLFRAGLGGRVGMGQQWMSWVAIDDLVEILYAALMDDALSGPINATAPNAVTNLEFTKTLGRVLRRPTLAPAPAFALRLALGEAADELALSSAHVIPKRLLDRGHPFHLPNLDGALRFLLGR